MPVGYAQGELETVGAGRGRSPDMHLLRRGILRFYTLIEFVALGGSLSIGAAAAWYASHAPLWAALPVGIAGIALSVWLSCSTATRLDRCYQQLETGNLTRN